MGRRMTGTIGLTTALTLVALCTSSAAAADFTPVMPPPAGEPNHLEILEQVYSPGTPWTTFGTRMDPVGNVVDLTNGTLSAVRVYDDGPNRVMNVVSGSPGGGADQFWTGGPVWATARARYAGYEQEFGYDLIGDGTGYVKLFDVIGSGTAVSGAGYIPFSPTDMWSWVRSGSGHTWYSHVADNPDGLDHLVTYELVGLNDGQKRWLLFWEDLHNLGDRDYNDLFVEITAIPEPTAGLLALLATALAVGRRRG